MVEEQLYHDEEVLATINDIKTKIKNKREHLQKWENRLVEWETNLKTREDTINFQMKHAKEEISKILNLPKKKKAINK